MDKTNTYKVYSSDVSDLSIFPLIGIYPERSNTNISECLSVHLRADSYSYWWKQNNQYKS